MCRFNSGPLPKKVTVDGVVFHGHGYGYAYSYDYQIMSPKFSISVCGQMDKSCGYVTVTGTVTAIDAAVYVAVTVTITVTDTMLW